MMARISADRAEQTIAAHITDDTIEYLDIVSAQVPLTCGNCQHYLAEYDKATGKCGIHADRVLPQSNACFSFCGGLAA